MSATVTTIIPTFRRPKLLQRALRSALDQTHQGVRVCVYDNASGDETASVVAAVSANDPRVSYFCHPQTVPVAQNFQFGLDRVATPFFSFLSDDDVLFPNFYATALARLENQPEALFAAGSAIEYDESGSVRYAPLALWNREGQYAPPDGFTSMLNNRHPTLTAILFRHEVVEKVGALDTAISGPADLDYELRVAARFPYEIFYEPSAAYVHHENRISTAEDARVIEQYQRIADNLRADERIAPALRVVIPRLLERQMRRKLYEVAVKSIVAGLDDNARAAAALLRTRFSRPVVASLIDLTAGASERFPAVRRLLTSIESARVAGRAREAKRLLKLRTGDDGSSYARFLA
ncbi:MAG TPA: glycosyltransferase family 2 protein [Candidatus Acidoferrales bacterium]|nr:glycosyltransferase family 2 protein [Candidatus Acidoferrales bacterium]